VLCTGFFIFGHIELVRIWDKEVSKKAFEKVDLFLRELGYLK